MVLLDLYNAACSLAIGLGAGFGVMSRRVRDGVVIKVGLTCAALSHLVLSMLYLGATEMPLPVRAAMALAHTGLLLVLVGYLLASKRTGGRCRRSTDWIDLEG